ncbi:nuclease-related domain-containing protein [Haloplasma contractile]|nr:nuclease-related domain-containing protein [Haloplasma contractile]
MVSEKGIPEDDINQYLTSMLYPGDDPFDGQLYKEINKRYGKEAKVLINLYIPSSHKELPYSQVDIMFFYKGNIYVLELKDYAGKIYGIYKNAEWKQCIVNKYQYKNSSKTYTKVNKVTFQNPSHQNAWHIKCLKNICDTDYKNVVVFSDRSELFVKASNVKDPDSFFEYVDNQPDQKDNYELCNEFYYNLCLLNEARNKKVRDTHLAAIKRKHY